MKVSPGPGNWSIPPGLVRDLNSTHRQAVCVPSTSTVSLPTELMVNSLRHSSISEPALEFGRSRVCLYAPSRRIQAPSSLGRLQIRIWAFAGATGPARARTQKVNPQITDARMMLPRRCQVIRSRPQAGGDAENHDCHSRAARQDTGNWAVSARLAAPKAGTARRLERDWPYWAWK